MPNDAAASSKKRNASRKFKVPSGSQMDHLVATIYFLEWEKNILEHFTKSINRLFVAPITEHCVRKRVVNATITERSVRSNRAIETGRKLEEGVKVDETNDEMKKLQRRLKQAKKEAAEHGDDDCVLMRKDKWISVAENAVMYRLRTLVQMSGSLLIFMEKIRLWTEKNLKTLLKHTRECSDVLSYALFCFEAICAQADIFALEPVDRSKVRQDCSRFIEPGDPYGGPADRPRNKPLIVGAQIQKDVKRLEAQIDYYRTSVYLIGNSLTDITQTFTTIIPADILELPTRDIRGIMDRLPPAYHFPGDLHLTDATMKLLGTSPAGKRQLNTIEDANRRSIESMKTASVIEHSSIRPRSSRSAPKSSRKGEGESAEVAEATTPPDAGGHPASAREEAKSVKSEKTQSDSSREGKKKSADH